MAKPHWYVLKVRSGFEQVVAYRLRRMPFEVMIPEQKSILYCRFDLEKRRLVTSVPGILDILGVPEPTPCDSVPLLQLTTRLFL